MNEVVQANAQTAVPVDIVIPEKFRRAASNKDKGGQKEAVQVAEDLGTKEVLN